MKKKILTLTFTLILLIGLVAAVGMNANAADITCIANGNIYNVNDEGYLREYMARAEDGDTIKLTDDIVFQNAYKSFEIEPMYETNGGNVILDLNGYGLYVAADSSHLFDLWEVNNVSLHIINSDSQYDGWIQFIPQQADSSVFVLGSSNNELYIYDNVTITMGKSGGSVTGTQATYIINALSFGEIGIHGAYLENLFTNGAGLYFKNLSEAMRNMKVAIDGGTKITTKSSCIDLTTSTYYPDFEFDRATLIPGSGVDAICDNANANAVEKAWKFKDFCSDGISVFSIGGGRPANISTNSINTANYPGTELRFYNSEQPAACVTHTPEPILILKESHIMQCKTCGYSLGLEKHTSSKAVAATCTAKGYTAGYDCKCGYVTVKETNALGHTQVTDAAVAPTCTATGLTEGKHCSVCNEVLTAQAVVPALGHTEVKDAAVAATYTKAGKTEGTHCSVCNAVFVKQEIIPQKTLGKVEGLKVKTVKLGTGTKTSLTLAWTKVADAEKYEVQQYVNKKWKTVKTVKKASLTVKKLKANKSYKFRVRAIRSDAEGAYTTLTAKTVPLKTTLTLKSGSKRLTASWKTVANINGYEVAYSTTKKFTKKTTKTVVIKKAKTKKTTIKSLKKGKKYFVRVRAYKTVGGKNIYGAWSAVKNVKVK